MFAVKGLVPMDLLLISGADKIAHGSRTLLAHLIGTQELLQQAGYSSEICTAGLLHSVYGTNSFKISAISPAHRDHVRVAAGEEAERLAWLFHIINRPHALHDAVRFESWEAKIEQDPTAQFELQGREPNTTVQASLPPSFTLWLDLNSSNTRSRFGFSDFSICSFDCFRHLFLPRWYTPPRRRHYCYCCCCCCCHRSRYNYNHRIDRWPKAVAARANIEPPCRLHQQRPPSPCCIHRRLLSPAISATITRRGSSSGGGRGGGGRRCSSHRSHHHLHHYSSWHILLLFYLRREAERGNGREGGAYALGRIKTATASATTTTAAATTTTTDTNYYY